METQTFFGTQFLLLLLLSLLRRSPNFPVEIYALGRIGERVGRRWQKKFSIIFMKQPRTVHHIFVGKRTFPRIKEPNFPFTAENSNFSLFTQITLNGSNKKGEREGKGYAGKEGKRQIFIFPIFFSPGKPRWAKRGFLYKYCAYQKGGEKGGRDLPLRLEGGEPTNHHNNHFYPPRLQWGRRKVHNSAKTELIHIYFLYLFCRKLQCFLKKSKTIAKSFPAPSAQARRQHHCQWQTRMLGRKRKNEKRGCSGSVVPLWVSSFFLSRAHFLFLGQSMDEGRPA